MQRWHGTSWLCAIGIWAVSASYVIAAEPNYGQDHEFLESHSEVIELTDSAGKVRVAVCPKLQGRVMTSTLDGPGGRSFGWINREFLSAGQDDKRFNNYGGEDRFWLGPEGGQFSLWFAQGSEQKLANWYTPAGLNSGIFARAEGSPTTDKTTHESGRISLRRNMELVNASGTRLQLEVERTIELADVDDLGRWFGMAVVKSVREEGVRFVGFQSGNHVVNRGADWTEASGLAAVWILGMFKPGKQTVIVVPCTEGPEARLGPVVNADYFGKIPPERLHVTPGAVYFLGDGEFRSKIGISGRRVKPIVGSYDFAGNVLTLVHFTVPQNPGESLYVDNTWILPQAKPFAGDAVNSYNDGPPEPGAKSLGGFYELETLSPTRALKTGEALEHQHTTVHLVGPTTALKAIAREALGVDLDEIRSAMFP